MATTKLSATKSTSRAINYAENGLKKSGLNCDIDYAKSSFKATRELYGKTGAMKAMSLFNHLNQAK